MMSTRLRLYLFGLLATLPLHSAAESIRLAPPQAMFAEHHTESVCRWHAALCHAA